MSIWLPAIFLFLSSFAIYALGWFRQWSVAAREEKDPFGDNLLLRPAGESLRKRLDELNDSLVFWIITAALAPAGYLLLDMALYPAMGIKPTPVNTYVCYATALVFLIVPLWKIVAVSRMRRDCWLGFHGERAVAESINQLMRDGCYIFHDVPIEPYGNIDHVIVAQSGIFAVETKTRRKRKAPKGRRSYEVIFDGQALEFPHCRETQPLEQARYQANLLRKMLTKAIAEPVKVTAILTFPGWLVTSRVDGEIKVQNPNGIRGVVLRKSASTLPPKLMQRIAYQLEQQCRDVEF